MKRFSAAQPVTLLVALLLGGCLERQMPPGEERLPDQVIEEFELVETASGRRVFRLEAVRAFVYDADGRVEVHSPRVTFLDDDGSVFSTLEADSGTISPKSQDLVARGHVRIATEEGTSLATDSLTWSNREQVVRTDAPVVVGTPSGRIEGHGLVSDAGLSKVTIKSEVRGSADFQIAP